MPFANTDPPHAVLVFQSFACVYVFVRSLRFVNDEQKIVEEEELIALNPRQKIALPLTEKEVLSDKSRRFRFGLPTKDHKLGLPVGKVCAAELVEIVLVMTVVLPFKKAILSLFWCYCRGADRFESSKDIE